MLDFVIKTEVSIFSLGELLLSLFDKEKCWWIKVSGLTSERWMNYGMT